MMIRRIFIFYFIFFPLLALSSENFCINKRIRKFDPHQAYDTVDLWLLEKLYLPLIASSGKQSLAEKFESSDGITWLIKLRSDARFEKTPEWRGRSVIASDVVTSLQRQLAVNAKTIFEKNSYLPARTNGLRKNLKEIKALSPKEIKIVLNKKMGQDDFLHMLGGPSGIVVPSEFFKSSEFIRPWTYFPSTRGMFLKKNKGYLELMPIMESSKLIGRKDSYIIKSISGMTGGLLSKECDTILAPTLEQEQSLKRADISFRETLLGKVGLYLKLDKNISLNAEEVHFLRYHLHKSMSSQTDIYGPINGVGLGKKSFLPALKGKMKNNALKAKKLFFCQMPFLDPTAQRKILLRFQKLGGVETGLYLQSSNCEEAFEVGLAQSNSFGALISIFHHMEESYLRQFLCKNQDLSDFFCSKEPQEEALNREFFLFRRVIPLFSLDQKLLTIEKKG